MIETDAESLSNASENHRYLVTTFGITPDVENKLKPYQTTTPTQNARSAKKSPSHAEVGLGLSTAYAFARQSGGHLSIASEPGQGTTVRIYLPQAERVARRDEQDENAAPPRRGCERILVVDDDDNVRRFAENLLARLGYSTVSATDGPAALAILRSGQYFDLLFTDIVLPKHMNGLELAHEARKLQPNLPLLFASGYSEEVLDRQGPRGADFRLLRKPYLNHELAATLRRILDVAGDLVARAAADVPHGLSPRLRPRPSALSAAARAKPP